MVVVVVVVVCEKEALATAILGGQKVVAPRPL